MCTLFSIKLPPWRGIPESDLLPIDRVYQPVSRKGSEALLESEVLFCSNKSGRNHPMNDKLKEVSLTEMLDAREARAFAQKQLLNRYGKPLICLTLNIPGPVKVLPGVPQAFEEACKRIEAILKVYQTPVLYNISIREKTGYEAIYCVDDSPEAVKGRMTGLEDADRLGRLFDIDVLRTDGTKVSREELGHAPRTCLLCGEPAHVCSRSRRHTIEELTAEITGILDSFTSQSSISPAFSYENLCRQALMAEVSATPKPGLVDRHDNGAHHDMNYQTFAVSTEAIVPYLNAMYQAGENWSDPKGKGLFLSIRPIGVEAEKSMFQATKEVNTHKGMIFSMGIISAAAGLYQRFRSPDTPFLAEDILKLAGQICRDEIENDFDQIRKRSPRTHGEMLFKRYNIKGIRGEAQKGFPSIVSISLPAYRKYKSDGIDDNVAAINTLLALMNKVNDTNVLIRTNHNLLSYEKMEAGRILAMGGAGTAEGLVELRKLNREFIRLNISPGGCADLLAVTILLWNLEKAFS